MKRLRVGVIGAGRISAGSHLPCLANYGDVDLVLCEVDDARLAAGRRPVRDPGHAHSDYREMLAQRRPRRRASS